VIKILGTNYRYIFRLACTCKTYFECEPTDIVRVTAADIEKLTAGGQRDAHIPHPHIDCPACGNRCFINPKDAIPVWDEPKSKGERT
jgi:hypothetical protein